VSTSSLLPTHMLFRIILKRYDNFLCSDEQFDADENSVEESAEGYRQ
jgi:hypothetical protein